MRKILYILLATLVATSVASCKSKSVVTHTMYDTITIERAIVQEVVKHDTLTVTQRKDSIVTRIELDTLLRPVVITRIDYTDKLRVEQGNNGKVVVRDTVYISQGHGEKDKKETAKVNYMPLIIYASVFGLFCFVGYFVFKRLK